MKNPFKKECLTTKVEKKQIKKAETIIKTPLIRCEICLGRPAEMECNSTSIHLLCDALGEPTAVEWLEKYRAEFDKVMKRATAELEEHIKNAMIAKQVNDKEE